MKAFNKIFAAVIAAMAILFAAANIILSADRDSSKSGRPYRVEINRLVRQIETDGQADLSGCEYVTNIEHRGENFFDTDSDYVILEIHGELYRFDYQTGRGIDRTRLIVTVNIILGAMAVLIISIMLYIGFTILAPFKRLTDTPYELSKGNLTAPIKETKNRYFGKFIWGVDMLRENIEQQKQRELELQKEKKMLLLSLSHDIKTPLSAIKLYSSALAKKLYSDEEKQRETAVSIGEKADEIESYVSRIITASREDFLSLDVENGEFYLSDLVRNIEAYYIEKLELVKTEFTVGEYRNCLLFGDLNRAVEVLQNVIENAIKYGDGKRIEILFPSDDEGVLISIRNEGCALDKSELPHIFESFRRGSNSENVRGSGLGLYICRQLMHKMNGEIFAEINGGSITVTAVFGRA